MIFTTEPPFFHARAVWLEKETTHGVTQRQIHWGYTGVFAPPF